MEDLQFKFNEAMKQAHSEMGEARHHIQLSDLFRDSAVAMLRRNRYDIGYHVSDSDVERICDNLAVVGLSEAQALIEPLVGFDYAVKAERFKLVERHDVPKYARYISFQIGKRRFEVRIPLAAAYDVPGSVPKYQITGYLVCVADPFPANVQSKFEQMMKDEKET